jgi:RNA polymerase sigma-70 factor (ECF subfamily)
MTDINSGLDMRLAVFDESAFERYDRELHRYLSRRLHQPSDVDDVSQEIYLRLLQNNRSTLVSKPLRYLYGVAAHVLADFWADRFEDHEHLVVDSDAVESWCEEGENAAEDHLADNLNLHQQIEQAMAQLAPTHAAVLMAHKGNGLTYEEVAAKLGLSIHTVEKYVTQAKAMIRRIPLDR